MVVNTPPTGGVRAGDGNAVEAVVTLNVPRYFTAIYSTDPVPISARAVAAVQPGAAGCVLALNESRDGAITVTGSSDSTMSLCDMVSNSAGAAFVMSGGSATVSANCIQTVGTAVTTSNLTVNCSRLREHAAPLADPFADVKEPALTGGCQSGSVGANDQLTTVTPVDVHDSGMASRHYCNGLDLRGEVHFGPGLYLIEGGNFNINSNTRVGGRRAAEVQRIRAGRPLGA